MFHKINGGSIYDITIVSNVRYTDKLDCSTRVSHHIGSFAAVAYNGTFVNVNSEASFTLNHTNGDVVQNTFYGGLVGHATNPKMYKSTWKGTMTVQATTATTGGNNLFYVAGLIGYTDKAYTIDACTVSGAINVTHSAPNIGGITGIPTADPNSYVCIMQNIVINLQINYKGAANQDIGLLFGEQQAWGGDLTKTNNNGSIFQNIYITGGVTLKNESDVVSHNNVLMLWGLENDMNQAGVNDYHKNIVLPANSSQTIYPSKANVSTLRNNATNIAGVASSANSNSAVSGNFSVASNGTVTSKVNSTYNLSYIKGAGATGGPSDTTYSYSSAAQTKNVLKKIFFINKKPDKLLNGSKYYYSTANSSNSNTAVTVDSSQGHGTQKNPFVINNINQWQLFINVINANNTTYNAAGKYYVLGNNLALSDITPVGTSSSGFKGILCGNKHTITVSSFSGTVYAANKANVRLGLFDRLIGAQIYDIIVTLPTITLTHSTISASTDYVGGLAVQCDNNTILANVNTTVNATRNDTKSTRVSGAFNAGGLVAYCSGGKFYKCSTVATFAYNKTVGNSGDSLHSGGAVGTSGAGTLIIDSCSFKLTASVKLAAGLTGGVIGVSTGSLNNQWQNLFVNANLYKYNASGTSIDINTQNNGSTSFDSSCDWGSLIGWNGDVVYTSATTSYYKNIYVTGTHPGQLCGVTGGPYCNFGSKSTNIITAGAAPSNTQWGSAANTGVNNTNVTSTANVVSRANQNGTLTGNFTINSNGTVTSKVNSTYNLSYIKGAGATGGPSDTTYSLL